jgi:Reverse transcriptase (RNA-dependent DNA polymerase)
MLNKAKQGGYLKGLGNFNNNNLINLNYADDTLIFLQADTKMMEVLKVILIGFENLIGLKINYTKSELIPLNLREDDSINLAQIIGCKISKLPINYLGVPLS